MSLQRQHILVDYIKTSSVGPAGIWIRDLRRASPVLY